MHCSICNAPKSVSFFGGQRVCKFCYLVRRHNDSPMDFIRQLKKSKLFDKFLILHPEVIRVDGFGNKIKDYSGEYKVNRSRVLDFLKSVVII